MKQGGTTEECQDQVSSGNGPLTGPYDDTDDGEGLAQTDVNQREPR